MKRALATLAIFTLLMPGLALADAPQKIGVVGSSNPSASATDVDQKTRALKAGDPIYLNDTVNTDGKGAVQLMFLDKSALTVNPNSAVKVDTFVYNPATSSGEMSMQNAKGALRFIGGALSKNNPVTIKTPVATIGIRGGIGDVHVDGATGKTDSVFVYGEQMSMTNMNGDTQVTTSMGSGFSLPTGDAMPQAMSPTMVANSVAGFQQDTVTGSDPSNMPNADAVDNQAGATGGGSGGGDTPSDGSGSGNSGGSSSNSDSGSSDSASNDSGNDGSGNSGGLGGESSSNDSAAAPSTNMLTRSGDPVGAGGNLPPVAANVGNTAGQDNTRVFANNEVTGGNNPLLPPPPGSKPPTSNQPPATTPPVTETTPPPVVPPTTVVNNNPNNGNPPPPPPPPVLDHGGYFTQTDSGPVLMGQGYTELAYESGTMTYEGNAVRVLPTADTRVLSLDYNNIAGFQSGVEGTYGADTYTGNAYGSMHGAMTYYRLENDTGTDQITALVGKRIAPANYEAAVTNSSAFGSNIAGLTFYSFLPEMKLYDGGGSPNWGLFSYNLINDNLRPGGAPMADPNAIGMAVDWNNRTYLASNLFWVSPELVTAYGRVDTTGGSTPLLSGSLFNFKADNGPNPYEGHGGYTRVLNDVYGNSGGIIDGFLFEAVVPSGWPATATPFSDPGMRTHQPVMVTTTSVTPQEVGGRSTGINMNGFMAGYLIEDATGAETPIAYWNTDPSNLTISRAPAGIGATIQLEDVAGSAPDIAANFGEDASTENAHVRDRIYAMQQGNMVYDPGGTNDYANDATKGVLMTATGITYESVCDTCEHAHWGVWAAEVDKDGTQVDVANMIPYVAGELTPDASLTTGNVGASFANYSGEIVGTKKTGAGILTNHVAGFTSTFDVANKEIDSFTANLSPVGMTTYSLSGSQPLVPGTSAFNLTLTGGAGATVNGALFGPAAEEMAGNLNAANGPDKFTGIFIGKR